MFWETVGLAATLCVILSYVPQMTRSYHTKKMDDFSMWYLIIIALGIFLWIAYGIHIGDGVVIYANIAIFAMAILLIAMKVHYSRKR
ncbi:MAG: hypothetical protein JW789_04605 [Candidatus Aenigmarchaeota archaeon]|nr:hypothetical protein [Candidatus Aenigmarchaeota archaeon]